MAGRTKAHIEGDTARIASSLADEYVQTDIYGYVQDKTAWLNEYFKPLAELIKAGRLLDLYQRLWKGRKLGPDEFVLCADEKTSIQARLRKHQSLAPQPNRSMRIEHEYKRLGSWACLAALDVHRAKIFGRCETNSGIAPFDRLVDQVMKRRPYCQARRVFWIVDNGSAHRGPKAAQRLLNKYHNLRLVHGPIHASWLNQIEIYFSIVQRKVFTPNDFTSLTDLSQRLMAFEHHYQAGGGEATTADSSPVGGLKKTRHWSPSGSARRMKWITSGWP